MKSCGASNILKVVPEQIAKNLLFGLNLSALTFDLKLKWLNTTLLSKLIIIAYPSISTAIRILLSGDNAKLCTSLRVSRERVED